MVTRYGVPCSIYQDRHGSLHRNDDNWTLEEQLNGEQDPTQVGGCLQSLGITPIFALTPQAKGRIERLFGVLQDRLIAELALRDITEMDAGNRFLAEQFIDEHNRRFAVKSESSQKAWRKVPKGLDSKRAISFCYHAVVGNDNAVRLGSMVMTYQKVPDKEGMLRRR